MLSLINLYPEHTKATQRHVMILSNSYIHDSITRISHFSCMFFFCVLVTIYILSFMLLHMPTSSMELNIHTLNNLYMYVFKVIPYSVCPASKVMYVARHAQSWIVLQLHSSCTKQSIASLNNETNCIVMMLPWQPMW
jgi:hypothetical protein